MIKPSPNANKKSPENLQNTHILPKIGNKLHNPREVIDYCGD